MKVQLRHLQYFTTLAETLSFSQAAAKLCITQPTLSQQIAQLEEILDVTLVERSSRGVSLTPAGHFFYTQAKTIEHQLTQAVDEVKHIGKQQKVVIGIPDYYSFPAIYQRLELFAEHLPEIQFETREMKAADMQFAIENGKIDIGFLAFPFPHPSKKLTSTSIAKEPFFLCMNGRHPNAQRPNIVPTDFTQTSLILLPKETNPGFYEYVIHGLQMCEMSLSLSDASATSLQAQYALVSANMGVCIDLGSAPLPSNDLVRKPFNSEHMQHDLHLVWHSVVKREVVEQIISISNNAKAP